MGRPAARSNKSVSAGAEAGDLRKQEEKRKETEKERKGGVDVGQKRVEEKLYSSSNFRSKMSQN